MNKDILAQKEADVIALSEKMEAASSVVLEEYRGLSVKEVTELRRALREEDVEFKVYRNAIARRAAEKLGHEDFAKTLVGPNALAFGKDPVAPARVLAKFAKTHKNLVIKAGIVEGKLVGTDEIKELSKLPDRKGMYSMLLACLKDPMAKVARVINAVAEARDGAAPAAEEAAPAAE